MKLTKLQLENFRNYKQYEYEFGDEKKLTIINGPNGKGKTNFLEAIYILSLGKSFRATDQEDIMLWGMDYLRVTGEVVVDDESNELEVFYTNHPAKKKNFKKNGVNLKNSEYIGNFLTVLFQPEDLNILYLSPSLRRKYMDILLSQSDKKYIVALMQYNKALKQRNALLREIRDMKFKNQDIETLLKDLDAWDEELAKFGTTLIEKRLELVEFLNKKLSKIYKSISGGKEKVKIEYEGKGINDLKAALTDRRSHNILQAKTTVGPHRHDLIFHIDDHEIQSSASRGEFRTLLLSIKLAEIDFLKKITGHKPILLLDDVFSELDADRQKKLIEAIKDCQTIITTTELAHLGDLADDNSKIHEIKID